ncbi:MAG: hypothetical protein K8R21_04945 [Leptospira sp.]|nr:hypothetical protein [Leptospira sp.]
MKVCFLREKDVTDEEIKDLLIAWATELMFYNIIPEKAIVSDWKRGGYWGSTISQQLQLYPLRPPCDRIVALVGRSPVDIVTEIFSLILFAFVGFKLEIHGAVDGYTHTRGYILSKYTTLFQLITGGPKSTLIHEGYHLLGCGHSLTLTDCYKQIHFLKEAAAKAKMDGSDFFPAITTERELFLLREGVNRRLGN